MPKIDRRKFKKENKDEKIQHLTITLTEDCNLNCRYCYENKRSRKKKRIAVDNTRKILTKILAEDNGIETVSISFFGGEPFLAFREMKQIFEWIKSGSWKKRIYFSIGTNGTILTDEIKEWLTENKDNIGVGVSLDGCKIAHDLNRDNSYDVVNKNLPFFMSLWPEETVKMTISAESIPYVSQSIIELEERGIPFTANVVFEDIWGDEENKERLLAIYEDELLKLVDYYVDHPELFPATVVGQHMEYLLLESDKEAGIKSDKKVKRYCGAGHEMRMIDTDGSIYPCQRFAPWITNRPLPDLKQNHQEKWGPEQCSDCKLVSICPTCAGYNYEVNGNSGIRTTFHCEAFKREVLASAKLQAIKIQNEMKDIDKLSDDEAYILKRKLSAILEIDELGL